MHRTGLEVITPKIKTLRDTLLEFRMSEGGLFDSFKNFAFSPSEKNKTSLLESAIESVSTFRDLGALTLKNPEIDSAEQIRHVAMQFKKTNRERFMFLGGLVPVDNLRGNQDYMDWLSRTMSAIRDESGEDSAVEFITRRLGRNVGQDIDHVAEAATNFHQSIGGVLLQNELASA